MISENILFAAVDDVQNFVLLTLQRVWYIFNDHDNVFGRFDLIYAQNQSLKGNFELVYMYYHFYNPGTYDSRAARLLITTKMQGLAYHSGCLARTYIIFNTKF